jgi:hypothetical protein
MPNRLHGILWIVDPGTTALDLGAAVFGVHNPGEYHAGAQRAGPHRVRPYNAMPATQRAHTGVRPYDAMPAIWTA